MQLPYCTVEKRFLLDRYVEGTCPICGDANARGDQCDNCGNVLDPIDLTDRRCKFDGSEPELRDSGALLPAPSAYNDQAEGVALDRQAALAKQRHQLRPRHPRTGPPGPRDHPRHRMGDSDSCRRLRRQAHLRLVRERHRLPLGGHRVGGAVGAARTPGATSGRTRSAKSYYFIGKDNIWFHTLSWPAQLMGYSEANGEPYNLPYDVPANQYQTIRGSKASTSRRLAVFVPDFLSRYDPDALRYYLSATMPETSDSDFTWTDFVRRNNDELVATWGNLVNRVLTFTYRNFDRRSPGARQAHGRRSLAHIPRRTGDRRDRRTHRALPLPRRPRIRYVGRPRSEPLHRRECALEASQGGPQALRHRPPHGHSRHRRLNVALSPYLPFTAETLHGYLGNEDPSARCRLEAPAPSAPASPLADAKPLFKKLDLEIIEEEEARLGALILVDSHCHLQDPKFRRDLPEVIERARAAGVSTIIVPGYDMESSRRASRNRGGKRQTSSRRSACTRTTPRPSRPAISRYSPRLPNRQASSPSARSASTSTATSLLPTSQRSAFREQLALAREPRTPGRHPLPRRRRGRVRGSSPSTRESLTTRLDGPSARHDA